MRSTGVITVVDALHGMRTLDQQPEAQAQVGFADRLLISKTDLVDGRSAEALVARVKAINPRAPLRHVHFGETPIPDLLAVGGFDLDAALEQEPQFLAGENRGDASGEHHPGHAHDHGHAQAHVHEATPHSDSIAAFSFAADRPFDAARLEQLFAALAEGYGPDLLRYKGILSISGVDHRVVLQGVQWVMGTERGRPWADAPRTSKIVFIGRDLDRASVVDSLNRCLVA